MKYLLIAALFLIAVVSINATTCTREQFQSFKVEFDKVYPDAAEEDRRFEVFCSNMADAHKRNVRAKAEGSNVEFGMTKFSDMSPQEFKQKYLGCYKPTNDTKILNHKPPKHLDRPIPQGYQAPQTFDWRTHSGVLTPVYNQGQCGSCWAFSATENIESQWALSGKTLTQLSMQQVVDCDTDSDGCNGGWTQHAYNYVEKAGGLDSYKSYPYTGQGGSCRFNKANVAATIKSWKYVGQNNEQQMVNFLSTGGPISICVDATPWYSYRGGVMTASQCGNAIDHCVLIVGYDLNQGYWIVRNSWGSNWGVEGGYILLAYGQNTCNLANEPTSAVV